MHKFIKVTLTVKCETQNFMQFKMKNHKFIVTTLFPYNIDHSLSKTE